MITWLLLSLGCSGDDDTIVAAPTSGTFTALTYNVHGLPDALTGDDGEARMRAISPLLNAFDIVGLQETFDEVKHGLLTAEADHEIQLWTNQTLDESRVYGDGLGMLARGYPLVDQTSVFYSACYGLLDGASDCLASKGFQVMRIQVGDAELDIYNTHQEAGSGEADDAARAVQVDEVLAHMDSWSAGRAVVLMGDTNLRPSEPPDAALLAVYADAGLRDACVEIGCAEDDHIDRFLFRDSDALQLFVEAWGNDPAFYDDAGVPLSDHPAITARFAWATE
jgi:endonuclease/exonuclease/phosphatase family metal-dependent hydrolase